MKKTFTDQQIALVLIEYKYLATLPMDTQEQRQFYRSEYAHLLAKWGITRSVISIWLQKAGLSPNWKRGGKENNWELIKKLVNN